MLTDRIVAHRTSMCTPLPGASLSLISPRAATAPSNCEAPSPRNRGHLSAPVTRAREASGPASPRSQARERSKGLQAVHQGIFRIRKLSPHAQACDEDLSADGHAQPRAGPHARTREPR